MTAMPPAAQVRPRTNLLLAAVGAVCIVAGIASAVVSSQRMGVDFAQFHLIGSAIVHGENVYDDPHLRALYPERYGFEAPIGMFYPPSTGFAMLPFGLIPYPLAKTLWLWISLAAIVLGIRALVRLVRPDSGAHDWMLSSGIVLLTAVIRWGMTPLQAAPILLGLLCWFIVALAKQQSALIVVMALFVTAFKVTIAVPFLGLLILYRWYRTVAFVLAMWLALNVVGFLHLGRSAFPDYQHEMTLVEGFSDINSPNPWNPRSIPRTDWVYLFYGLTMNLPLARILSGATAVIVGGWLAWRVLRVPQPVSLTTTAAFLGAFVCWGTLAVYHHQYDLCLFIAPCLMWWVSREARTPPLATALVTPLLVLLALLPIARAQRVIISIVGEAGLGLFNMLFPITTSLALAACVVVIWRLGPSELAPPALSVAGHGRDHR